MISIAAITPMEVSVKKDLKMAKKYICCEIIRILLENDLLVKETNGVYLKGDFPEGLRTPFIFCPYCGENPIKQKRSEKKSDKSMKDIDKLSQQIDDFMEAEGFFLVNR